jgi:hypothetical protein
LAILIGFFKYIIEYYLKIIHSQSYHFITDSSFKNYSTVRSYLIILLEELIFK